MPLLLPCSVEALLACAVCAVVVYLLQRTVLAVLKFRRYEMAIPGPPSLPVLGNALCFAFATREDAVERIFKLKGQRRDMFRASILHKLFVVVSKPEDVEAVMKRRDLSDKSIFFYHLWSEVLPSALPFLNGPKWKKHRVASTPAFRPEIIDNFTEVFVEEAEKFNASVEPYKEFLLQDKLFSTTMWSFCRSVMMSQTPTKEQEESASLLMQFLQFWIDQSNYRMYNPLLWPEWIYSKTKEGRLMRREFQKVRQFCREIMEVRATELNKRDGQEDTVFLKARNKTLLDVLLQAHSKDEQAFPKEDVLDELVAFLVAATETTVSALNFTFKMLSLRADIQQKVYEEVKNLLGSGAKKRSIVPQDLPKLEYTERVIKEAMRMFAPVPFIARGVKEDTELCGHQLPKGTTVTINLLSLHRDPVTWPDPLRFDPDRFLPEQSEGRHPYAYLPFSSGPRNCIGYRFAWAEMKSVVATAIRDFIVEPANDGLTDHTQFNFNAGLGLKLNGGVRVNFTPRTASTT